MQQVEKTELAQRLKNVYALKKEFAKTDAKCVLALISLDRFSGVNAAYGIDVGDMLLYEFCNIIKKNPSPSTVSSIDITVMSLSCS